MNRAAVAFAVAVAAAAASAWRESPDRAAPAAHDFRVDVLPHLQRLGCSSAYCHGSATGQGGFKLSLFGSDPVADYAAIVTEFGGRRIDRNAPDTSLIVQKALGKLDHGGGRRLPRDGEAHATLRAWIAAAAPWRGPDVTLGGLVVRREADRLLAIATVDGREVDVTERALFSTSHAGVVEVAPSGAVREIGPGRAHAIARWLDFTATIEVLVPFGATRATPASTHALDAAWHQHASDLGVAPASPVSTAVLARRLHLDLLGRPPTPQELRDFAAKPQIADTVRHLTTHAAFAEVWGEHLARWFDVPTEGGRRQLVAAVRRGDSLRTIARQVADGTVPAWVGRADPRDRAEHAARALLGVRIGCARCHDHPDDRWRRGDHLAFSAAFAPPRAAPGGGMTTGVLFDDAGQVVAPRWLALPGTRHAGAATFAEFVLDDGHQQLARHLANRLFAELLGRGLVEPADDHRPSNPALHAGMLAALVDEFVRSEGALAGLLTFVMTSSLYALPTVAPEDASGPWLLANAVREHRDTTFARALRAVLGRDPSGELPNEPLARELALRNGDFVHDALARGGTTIDALFDFASTPRERLDALWNTVLSRLPRDDEVNAFLPAVSADLAAFRDLACALLLGREFGERR